MPEKTQRFLVPILLHKFLDSAKTPSALKHCVSLGNQRFGLVVLESRVLGRKEDGDFFTKAASIC
jgi:hypothetical protein